ncbi:MAG TPA: lipoyl(octanoyl) transferase LipB [bacterium]|nr:lipoyl(octanoyl) transferase LipB [bacterium]
MNTDVPKLICVNQCPSVVSLVRDRVPKAPAAVLSLGRVEYGRALELQRELCRLRAEDKIPDILLLLEHPPVITLGRSAKASNLLVSEAELARRGVSLYRIERGGDVTFHGPGQLIGYPVFKLEAGLAGVRRFVERVEAALVSALAELGVKSGLRPGYIGVWCEERKPENGDCTSMGLSPFSTLSTGRERKIASIGIAVKRRVTFHGFALNVTVDLDFFRLMNPCGMPGVVMTSVSSEGGVTDDARVRSAVVAGFERAFGVEFQEKLPRILTCLTQDFKTSAIASTSARV